MKMRMGEQKLTEGGILKALIYFALPMMAGNLLQQIYNIADTMIVGRVIGAEALAAVGASYTLMTFLTSVMIGLCMGSSASMSMSYGAGKREEMREKIWASFWMIGMLTVLIIILVYVFENPILKGLHVPMEAYEMMREYLRIIFGGIFFTFLYNYGSFLLRAVGNSIVPLGFLGTASVLNIILDFYLVLGRGMGVSGAAWATVIAQALSGIGISVYILKKCGTLLPGKGERVFRRTTVSGLAGYSFLTCLQQSVMNFGILMIQGLVNTFGTVVMAAFAAAVKIDTLAYMPAQEFGNAYSLFISQNYGAEKKERIRVGTGKAFLTSGVFCTIISALIWLNAKPLMGIFVAQSETEILAEGIHYLHIEGAFYIGIGFLFLLYGLYRGIAMPAFSLVLTIISLGSRVIIAYMLAPEPFFGVSAIWWAIPIGWFLADMAGILFYLFVIRKKEFVYEAEREDFRLEMCRQGIFRTLIEAIGTIYEEAETKQIVVEMASQHDQLLVHDRYWSARALVYILKNAVKYTEPGGFITVQLKEEDDRVGIEITDNGIGIPEKDLPHIFEKRFRGKNVLQKEGYGIGLYLARKIIEKENGEILCMSQEGRGTVFTVYLNR